MADLATCPLPEIAAKMREISDKASDDNDILRALIFGALATRFERADDEIQTLVRTLADCDAQSRRRLKEIEKLQDLLDGETK